MFKRYVTQVLLNAEAMAHALLKKGYTLVSGTDATAFLVTSTKHMHINKTFACV